MLTLQQLICTPVSVPLAHPLLTASGTVTHAPLVLIDLLTHQGVQGRSYLFTYSPLVLKPVVQLLENLQPLLMDQDLAPAMVEPRMDARFRLLGSAGLLGMALAGIDMALWDAQAQAAGLPLCRLLGGAPRPVPAYFSQGLDGIQRGRELAEEALRRGYRLMKIKAGYATLAEDLAVVRAVQQVLGTQCALAVDYNQSLPVPEALRRCHALDELDLAWIEEPTRQDDDAGHARIAAEIRTPIQLGENWFGTHEMARSLAQDACDLVMPDLMKIGGVSGWLRAAGLAAGARRPMSTHLFHEMSVHLMTVTPTAHWLEVMELADPVLAQPLRIENGHAIPSSEPGSGLQWDPRAVERFRVL